MGKQPEASHPPSHQLPMLRPTLLLFAASRRSLRPLARLSQAPQTPKGLATAWRPRLSAAFGSSGGAGLDWLRDPTHPRLLQFLKAERNYLSKQLNKPRFRGIERAFYREFRDRVVREDASVPERVGAFEYYMRQAPRENFPVYYRRHCETLEEQVLLDQNRESALLHGAYQFVTGMKVSLDERQLLVVIEDENEDARVLLRDLTAKKGGGVRALTDLDGIVKNVEWAASVNPRVFYFTKLDRESRRPYAVYRYNCATGAQELIYEEQDEAFFVDVSQTKDGAFVLINCNSKNTSEIHALASDNIQAEPRLLRPREAGTAYFADHADGRFFFVTNADRAANYKIAISESRHGVSNDWGVLLPEQEDVKIEDVDLLHDYLVLYERVASVPRIRVCHFGTIPEETGSGWGVVDSHVVELPKQHAIGRLTPGVNRDFTASSLRFSVSTPLEPEIVYDYELVTRKLTVRKQAAIEATFASPSSEFWERLEDQGEKKQRLSSTRHQKNSNDRLQFLSKAFTCHRSFVNSTGDTKVPLTLVHRNDLSLNGRNPTLLVAYGAYGHNLEADFTLEHLSLLERGWVIALAHVRGGGELGLRWYEDGKKLQKRHSFDDYIACARFLVESGVTSPALLAGKGASAGGLIMGVAANEHPDLFRALVMKVPFVDILATMSDTSLPLTVHEFDEWGNPNSGYGDDAAAAVVREYIRSYAPCENIREDGKTTYPSMLVTGSMNDQRVQYWEPVKWVWKLRHAMAARARANGGESAPNAPLLLLKMSEEDGHFGGGGRLEQLQESAMEMAFLYQALRLPFSDQTK